MLSWNSLEQSKAEDIANELLQYECQRQRVEGPISLRSDSAAGLIDGVRQTRYVNRWNFVPIRHLYRALAFNEDHPFSWRLEHKLVQALLLQHFCPGSVAVTRGLSMYCNEIDGFDASAVFHDLSRQYVKKALGSDAGPDNSLEVRAVADLIVSGGLKVPVGELVDEEWIIQDRVSIAEEYRVHTIEQFVVPELTYSRYSNRLVRADTSALLAFVESIIEKLPTAFLFNSICGWDICRTVAGGFLIIEINFGGYHPVVERGFQCSGFFAREPWGPYAVAHLSQFIERKYGVMISFTAVCFEPAQLGYLYFWINRWLTLARIFALVRCLNLPVNLKPELPVTCASYSDAERIFETLAVRLGRIADVM